MMDVRPNPGPVHVLVLAILLVLAVVMWKAGVPLLVEVWTESAESRVRIVAAVITVSGTLVSAIVGVLLFHSQQRARERERVASERAAEQRAAREEHRRHARFASGLRAEISESLVRLAQQFNPEAVLTALRADAVNFDRAAHVRRPFGRFQRAVPVGVGLERNIIFEQHQDDLRDLPEPVIWALVSYYQNDLHLARYLKEMTDGAFDNLALERQRRAAVQFRDLGQDTLRAGLRAKAMLDAFLIQHHADAGDNDEEPDIVQLARDIMARRPEDGELKTILETRGIRADYGELLLSLPKDEETAHLDAFFKAVGVSKP
jgi:hypothetical protein